MSELITSDKKYKKNPFNTSYFTAVISITLVLFVIGLFGILVIYADKITRHVKENVVIHLYLDNNLKPDQLSKMQREISFKPYIATHVDTSITFISKEKAAENFTRNTGEEFVKFLGFNPLRDAYTVRLNYNYTNLDSMTQIKKELAAIKGVHEADYQESLVEVVNQNIAKIAIILLGFVVVLFIIVVILINNTIKLSLFSQRFLIKSMQLVGANHFFVIRPFIWRAFLQGLLSGFLSAGMLFFVVHYSNQYIPELQILYKQMEFYILYGSILILGILIAVISSYRAIRKYLYLPLDELY